ncbi:hypothetical protein [Psychrobacillus phage Perkons]|nr:hypothetical protein [Psychrobacillus phage Perkons]
MKKLEWTLYVIYVLLTLLFMDRVDMNFVDFLIFLGIVMSVSLYGRVYNKNKKITKQNT